MRHREHSDEAIILGSGASTNEAIRSLTQIVAPQGGVSRRVSSLPEPLRESDTP